MNRRYIIGIDQSTQGTKAIMVGHDGEIIDKTYLPHKQIISENGWVSHDGEELFRNTVLAVKMLMERSVVKKHEIAGIGISNQRETTVAWNRETGQTVGPAIVWQCSRAKMITAAFAGSQLERAVLEKTGIPLSPFFPAAKAAWMLQNNPLARKLADDRQLCIGTVDSWLVYGLTDGEVFKTDASNASRTQLYNIHSLQWDPEICEALGIQIHVLPEVENSNGDFGCTTLCGYFDEPVPIRAVLGDSHAALYGHGCVNEGMAKATYGTGSSIMMNTGPSFKASRHGLVSSLAWSIDGRVNYVLEGNINYSGAVITWLQKDLGLISTASESDALAAKANPADSTYLVPAFSGLGAPYWSNDARALFCGMSRTTGRAELIKAGLESIAYQVTDIVEAMEADSGIRLSALQVDGGPTANHYLMQFQSDMTQKKLYVPKTEELSALGAAYMAGVSAGVLDAEILQGNDTKKCYEPVMNKTERDKKYSGWKAAVQKTV